jgi:gliding motility-associated-like protein
LQGKFKIIWIVLVVFRILNTFGVENRPIMRRACLNRSDSTLDLLWFNPTDNCGSFTSFSLYGRDNILNPFQFLKSYSSSSLNNVSIKLKNLKDWEFFLIYNKACNGVDSIYSDTISIDNTAPTNSELDSVSIDLITQRPIIGWNTNSSKDVKGYVVYYVNSSRTNIVIADTKGTFHVDNDLARNPAKDSLDYSVAAYDSCNNLSLISPLHRSMLLKYTYDECNQDIELTWNGYVGWPVQRYEIFRKINNGNYQLIGSVISNITKFTYHFPAFGDTYCFYIRALKTASSISSSSNIVCVSTNSIIPAKFSYIAKASVQNNNIELTLVTQTGTSLKKVNVYKGESASSFSLWQSINTNGGTIELIDNNVSVQSKSYYYYFTTEGACNIMFDTSQIVKTILLHAVMLSPGNQNINWSLYDNFIKLTQNQELLLSDDEKYNKSSPWNILSTFNNTVKFATDNSTFDITQQKICYCIRAIENPPNATYKRQDTSYSNIQCVTADPIVYFPNAIQINGYNTIFYPKGVFIDYEKSSFVIYNRWGQIIFETNDINKGWDGKENNEFVQSDVYVYKATIVGLNGTTLLFDGTITVLK